jgi:1-deoxy-D-xylulose-5-phosphate reductoisomerase
LAYEAAEAGGAKTVALNAADEVAVAAFLDGVISFEDIPRIIKSVLDETSTHSPESIEQVLQIDAGARSLAAEMTGLESSQSPRDRGVPSVALGNQST